MLSFSVSERGWELKLVLYKFNLVFGDPRPGFVSSKVLIIPKPGIFSNSAA